MRPRLDVAQGLDEELLAAGPDCYPRVNWRTRPRWSTCRISFPSSARIFFSSVITLSKSADEAPIWSSMYRASDIR